MMFVGAASSVEPRNDKRVSFGILSGYSVGSTILMFQVSSTFTFHKDRTDFYVRRFARTYGYTININAEENSTLWLLGSPAPSLSCGEEKAIIHHQLHTHIGEDNHLLTMKHWQSVSLMAFILFENIKVLKYLVSFISMTIKI